MLIHKIYWTCQNKIKTSAFIYMNTAYLSSSFFNSNNIICSTESKSALTHALLGMVSSPGGTRHQDRLRRRCSDSMTLSIGPQLPCSGGSRNRVAGGLELGSRRPHLRARPCPGAREARRSPWAAALGGPLPLGAASERRKADWPLSSSPPGKMGLMVGNPRHHAEAPQPGPPRPPDACPSPWNLPSLQEGAQAQPPS